MKKWSIMILISRRKRFQGAESGSLSLKSSVELQHNSDWKPVAELHISAHISALKSAAQLSACLFQMSNPHLPSLSPICSPIVSRPDYPFSLVSLPVFRPFIIAFFRPFLFLFPPLPAFFHCPHLKKINRYTYLLSAAKIFSIL